MNTKKFTTVTEGLKFFKDDSLLFEPGTQYQYSSYGWNLISAVIEGASNEAFLPFMKRPRLCWLLESASVFWFSFRKCKQVCVWPPQCCCALLIKVGQVIGELLLWMSCDNEIKMLNPMAESYIRDRLMFFIAWNKLIFFKNCLWGSLEVRWRSYNRSLFSFLSVKSGP